jgi:hypothetical protein
MRYVFNKYINTYVQEMHMYMVRDLDMGKNICDTPDNFALTEYISGDSVSLADYSGKAIVLSFVCIRSPVCMSWLQHLQNINNDYETNPDVQVVAVIYNYNDRSDGAGHSGPVTSDWIAERLALYGLTVTFPLLMDGAYASSVAKEYITGMLGPAIGFPYSYMISRDFVITNKWHSLSTPNGQPVSFDSNDLTDTEYFVRHRLEDLQKDRPAWDTVLALDYSGSMGNNVTVHGVTLPKVEFLKEAASTLLKVWKDYALCSDRVGSVFFNCHASMGNALSSVLSGNHVDDMITTIETKPTGGCTAMGAGIATALDLMESSTNNKVVVLFTDGMQNRNPLAYEYPGPVRPELHIDNIGSSSYPAGAYMCSCDGDGGQSDYAGSLPVNLEIADANIHTIGIGAGAIYQPMLNKIAIATESQFRMDVDIWPSLKEFFIETLVEMYRGSSLQVLQKGQGILASNESEVVKTFKLNRSVDKITVLLSWADAENPLRLQLQKDGIPIDLCHKMEEEPTYQFATLAFPHYQKTRLSSLILQDPLKTATVKTHAGKGDTIYVKSSTPLQMHTLPIEQLVSAEGDWELVIRRSFNESDSAAAYHYMVLADEKILKFDIETPNFIYEVGQPIPIAIRLSDKMGNRVKVFSVQTEIVRPTVPLPDVFAKTKMNLSSAEELDRTLDRDDIISAMRKTERDVVRLRPLHEISTEEALSSGKTMQRKGRRKDTEGRYRTVYANTKVPGLYRIEFRIRGVDSRTGMFERVESRHVIVAEKAVKKNYESAQ